MLSCVDMAIEANWDVRGGAGPVAAWGRSEGFLGLPPKSSDPAIPLPKRFAVPRNEQAGFDYHDIKAVCLIHPRNQYVFIMVGHRS
jgi:hypothetical protein